MITKEEIVELVERVTITDPDTGAASGVSHTLSEKLAIDVEKWQPTLITWVSNMFESMLADGYADGMYFIALIALELVRLDTQENNSE